MDKIKSFEVTNLGSSNMEVVPGYSSVSIKGDGIVENKGSEPLTVYHHGPKIGTKIIIEPGESIVFSGNEHVVTPQ